MIQELQIQCGLQDFNKSYYYKVSSCFSPLVKQKAPANLTKKSAGAIYSMPYQKEGLFIFFPALDSNVIDCHGTECMDKGACQTCICNQRNVQVDCCTTDLVTVVQFTC